VAYAIGVAKPVSLMLETFGTNVVSEDVIEKAVQDVFDLRPRAIIEQLDLLKPKYRKTATYGHFGRDLPEFTWEQLSKLDELKSALSL
jgi:S-adenosylmethionine synthetase